MCCQQLLQQKLRAWSWNRTAHGLQQTKVQGGRGNTKLERHCGNGLATRIQLEEETALPQERGQSSYGPQADSEESVWSCESWNSAGHYGSQVLLYRSAHLRLHRIEASLPCFWFLDFYSSIHSPIRWGAKVVFNTKYVMAALPCWLTADESNSFFFS